MKPWHGAALLLAGCVAGPDYHPPAAVPALLPARYANAPLPAAAASVPLREHWWTVFHDAALEQLVDAALSGHPGLAAADARVRAARAQLRALEGGRQPRLDAVARAGHDQFSRNSENFANVPIAHPATGFDDYRAGLDASWELDLAGGQARSIEAQAAQAAGAASARGDAALRLAAETARTVLDYRYAQLRLDVAATLVADRQALLRLVRLQQRAGLASDIEVSQAEAALHGDQAGVPPLQALRQGALAALVALTALPYADLQARLELPAPPPVVPEDIAVGAPSALLLRRPDVRGAERALAAASAQVGMATAQRWPRFTLVGSAGWDSVRLGSLTAQASRFWSLGPQLTLPLFNGGQVQAGIEASQALRDAAESEYRQAVLAALADVELALVRCREDRAQRHDLDALHEARARELELARVRAAQGDAPDSDWLAVHWQVAALDGQRLASEQALAEDVVTLFKALGGSAAADATGAAADTAAAPDAATAAAPDAPARPAP